MSKIFSRKGFVLITAALFLVGGFFVANVAQATGPTCTVPGDYATIQAAVNDTNCTTINVADDTYTLSNTLDISRAVTIQGTSESGTIIDASAVNGYGIAPHNADGIVLENFTLAGPTANSSGKYGIKAYDLINFTIRNVTVHGSGRSEVDLNRVTGASLIENVTANGENTAGVGIALSNSSGVTLNNITTLGNTWGGVGLYDTTSGPTTDITFGGTNSFGETGYTIYIDTEFHQGVSNITLPLGFNWAVHNTIFRAGRSNDFTLFQSSKNDAAITALSLQTSPYTTNTASYIQTVGAAGVLENNFVVENGMSIQVAVAAATSGATINVGAGTYSESPLINKSLTLVGVGDTKPVIAGLAPAIYIVKVDTAASVTLDNLEINGDSTNAFDYGVWVNHSGTSDDPIEVKNSIIKNIWKGSANGIEIDDSSYVLAHNNTISLFQKRGIRFRNSEGKFYSNDVAGESVNGVDRVQNLVTLWGGSNVEIYGNTLHNALTSVGSTPLWDSPGVFVSGFTGGSEVDSYANIHDNEIYNGDTGIVVGSVYAGGDGSLLFTDTDHSSANITDNNFHNLNWAINFEQETGTAAVHNNKFFTVNKAVSADVGEGLLVSPPLVDAANNWWGTPVESEISPLVYGGVNFSPWYINPGRTVLNTAVSSSGGGGGSITITAPTIDFAETEDGSGAVSLPDGTSELNLSNDSVLDFLASVNTAIGDSITVADNPLTLSSFTSGDLIDVDLSVLQNIGGQSVDIEQAVQLSSGSTGEPIILTNSALANVSVSIPDATTILAPSGWNGTMQPAKTASGSGTAPSGFTVGNSVIEVGSPGVVLLFDKPVTVTLTGVTGTVGYKPAGSDTWTTINTTCTGTYDLPTGAVFPGECKIVNDAGTSTRILTYHFTSFGGLNLIPPPSQGSPYPAPTPPAPTTPTPIVAVIPTPVGQVLGASTGPTVIDGCDNRTTGFSVTTGQSCIGNSPIGQVLGAEKFNFTKLLRSKLQSNEVIELQKFLNNNNYVVSSTGAGSPGNETNYFGAKTKAALIKFQVANNLKGDGVVGPKVRALLNK